jgi:prephenate dehydrogenase
MFHQVTIVGCGLLGGSFALAARRAGLAARITAFGGTRSLQLALERGVIDAIETSFADQSVCQADLIFLAAPIGGIIDFLKTRAAHIKPGAIVTDAGSTKAEICRAASASLPAEICFIGGHPMAGSEHTGVEFARADLFERATWALMNQAQNNQPEFDRLKNLVETIGARPLITSPELHDEAVARISHLPQIVSTILAGLLLEKSTSESSGNEAQIELSRRLAATGWRDMTRLAGSSWSIWRDIVMTNQPHITTALSAMIEDLQQLRDALGERDFNYIRESFSSGNQSTEKLRKLHLQSFESIKKT